MQQQWRLTVQVVLAAAGRGGLDVRPRVVTTSVIRWAERTL